MVRGMDRAALEQCLAEAEKQIAAGDSKIAEQCEAIALLERNGRPADHAKYILAGLQLLQAARQEHRDRLLKERDSL
jgi:hypothetical protein